MIHLELWITIQDFDFPARGQPLARAKLAWVVLFLFLLHSFPFFFASLAVYTAVLPSVLEPLPEPASQISRWLGPFLESMRAREPGLQAPSNLAGSKIKNTRIFTSY